MDIDKTVEMLKGLEFNEDGWTKLKNVIRVMAIELDMLNEKVEGDSEEEDEC
jgi:hypothetical protein